ncbi:hypothetical protein KEM55_006069, partial [Ascosphaera atra]
MTNALGSRLHAVDDAQYVEVADMGWETFCDSFVHRLLRWMLRCTKAAVAGLEPSFMRENDNTLSAVPERRNVISLLDGLRGIACLLVFNYHFFFTYTYQPDYGWGFSQTGTWHWHQLPPFHMLYSGHIMVDIFFVISGYVLSYKPLKLLRQQQGGRNYEGAFGAVASSAFRRGIRLYIPSVVGLLCVLIGVRMGAYNFSTLVRYDGKTVLGTNEEHPPIFDTFNEQVWDFYCTVWKLTDWWHWEFFYNNYNPHLWTIPVEFRCSMVLFMVLLALIRVRSRWRIALATKLACLFLRWSRWDVTLFIGGMIIAELDLICGIWEGPGNTNIPVDIEAAEKKEEMAADKALLFHLYESKPLWWTIFAWGLYLGSTPNRFPELTPGYMYLMTWVPEDFIERDRWWQAIGALMLFWSISHLSVLQQPFRTSFALYFGKISYAFYIVHGPILHSLGYSLMATLFG